MPATALVVGDLVLLDAGDRVSADLRLVTAAALAVDESLLTGESVPARPGPGTAVLAGTFVIEGEGTAVVEAAGSRTRLATSPAWPHRDHQGRAGRGAAALPERRLRRRRFGR